MARTNEIPVPQRKGLRWFTLLLAVACTLLANTWVRTESTQAMIRISKAQDKVQASLSYRKDLILERDRLTCEARITQIAQTRLGLSSDTAGRIIYLNDSSQDGSN